MSPPKGSSADGKHRAPVLYSGAGGKTPSTEFADGFGRGRDEDDDEEEEGEKKEGDEDRIIGATNIFIIHIEQQMSTVNFQITVCL